MKPLTLLYHRDDLRYFWTMNQETMSKLANLVLKGGVQLKKGQKLLINAEISHRNFVSVLTREAYKLGAAFVFPDWRDPELSKIRVQEATEGLDYYPAFLGANRLEMAQDGWAYIALVGSEDPTALDGLDKEKLGRVFRAQTQVLSGFKRKVMTMEIPWSIVPVPNHGWAKHLFPHEESPLEKLWDTLVPILKLDETDPVQSWLTRADALESLAGELTKKKIQKLRFLAPGTDLEVGLVPSSNWIAGRSYLPDGTPLLVNIPSEEIFTTPDFRKTSGKVKTTRPLLVLGTLVEGAWFEFHQGKVVDFGASKNKGALEAYLNQDEQASFLGEIALVDSLSPIFRSGLVFGEILLDENAACHFALGSGYPDGLSDGKGLSDKELMAKGCNVSSVHLDFMFGSKELKVSGTTLSGEELTIMVDGNFVLTHDSQ